MLTVKHKLPSYISKYPCYQSTVMNQHFQAFPVDRFVLTQQILQTIRYHLYRTYQNTKILIICSLLHDIFLEQHQGTAKHYISTIFPRVNWLNGFQTSQAQTNNIIEENNHTPKYPQFKSQVNLLKSLVKYQSMTSTIHDHKMSKS